MMEFVNLCKGKNLDIDAWMNQEQQELDDYFNFVVSLTDRQEIKDRILKTKERLTCYVIDSKQTLIPRVLEGKDRSFKLPDRADAFVREQNILRYDDEKYYEIKPGLAYRVEDWNGGVKFHELNHCLSMQLVMPILDGEVFKNGTRVDVLDLDEDRFVHKTGNFLDEALSDAIAKYYYDNKYKKQSDPEYNTAYVIQKITLLGQILLGENLSNKDLINAYFGSPEDLLIFETKFYNATKFDFRKILKMHCDINKSIDNENIPIDKLINLAVTYRINSAQTEAELESEMKFLQALNVLPEKAEEMERKF